MRSPKRVSERESATKPHPTNDQATIRLAAAVNAGVLSWLLTKTSVSAIAVKATAVRRIAHLTRSIALSKHSFERSAGQLALGNEASRSALGHERSEVRSVAARREDDDWPVAVPGQPRGNLEAVEIGQLDVEENKIGMKLLRAAKRGDSVVRFAHDLEPFGCEKCPRGRAKARVVVNDQDPGHVTKYWQRERPTAIRLATLFTTNS